MPWGQFLTIMLQFLIAGVVGVVLTFVAAAVFTAIMKENKE